MPLTPLNDWLSIEPGTLRHKISIQTPTTGNDHGVPSDAWTEIYSAKCSIDVVTARELASTSALTISSHVSHVIKLRWTASVVIAPGMRATVKSVNYSIQASENIQGRDRVLKLLVLGLNEAA